MDKALRMCEMIRAFPDAALPAVCMTIGVHPWSANPFAFFGSSRASLVNSAKSLGLLLFAQFVINSWLLTYGKRSAGAVGVFAPLVLPAMSLMLLAILTNTKRDMRRRVASADVTIARALDFQHRCELIWLIGFVALGLLFCIWVAILKGQIV
jgi:hypothetical protein